MTPNIKTITLSVASALLTLFIINHLILLFILSWLAAGYWGASILARSFNFPRKKFDLLDVAAMLGGYVFLLLSIVLEFEKFMDDIKWVFSKISGGKQIKFQSPVVISVPESK